MSNFCIPVKDICAEAARRIGPEIKTHEYTAKDIVQQVEDLPLADQVKELSEQHARCLTREEAVSAKELHLRGVIEELVRELLSAKKQLASLQYKADAYYKDAYSYPYRRSGAWGDD